MTPRIADRPHWITVAVGVLSPLLGLVAIVVSLRSLDVSREALNRNTTSTKITQRAYLRVAGGQFTTVETDSIRYTPGALDFTVSVDIQNDGNTPAFIENIAIDFKMPVGWRFYKRVFRDNYSVLPAKQSVRWQEMDMIELDAPAQTIFKRYQEDYKRRTSIIAEPRDFMRLRGAIQYSDLFKESHTIKWCWIENPSMRRFGKVVSYPSACPQGIE